MIQRHFSTVIAASDQDIGANRNITLIIKNDLENLALFVGKKYIYTGKK